MIEVQRFEMVGAGDLPSLLDLLVDGLGLRIDTDDDGARVWLDTATGGLAAAGLALEHRERAEGDAVLVVTRDGTTVTRIEHVARVVPDTAADLGLPSRIGGIVGDEPLLATAPVQSRVVVLARTDGADKTLARIAIDRTTSAEGDTMPILLEVQPLRGYERAARALVADLGGVVALAPTTVGILERLQSGGPRSTAVSAAMTASEGWRAVLRSHTATMIDRFGGVLSGEDPEDLHAFRVAVRQIRTVLRDGGGVLPKAERERFRSDFQWLGDITTPSRDADVHVLDHPAFVDLLPPSRRAELAPLLDVLVAERSEARARMERDLRSPRRAEIGVTWAAWLDDDTRWGRSIAPRAGAPIVAVAVDSVRDAHSRLVKDGRRIRRSSPATALHDLRKDAKRLRYLLENFAPVFDHDAVEVLTVPLRRLQEVLGAFQDSEVQARALQALLASRPDADVAMARATDLVIEHLDDRSATARKEFAKVFDRFDDRSVRRAIDALDRRPKGKKS